MSADDYKHAHNWQHLTGTRFVCQYQDCKLASDLQTIVSNAAEAAALEARVKLLSDQLFRGDLKKKAREAAYSWVVAQGATIANGPQQEALI